MNTYREGLWGQYQNYAMKLVKQHNLTQLDKKPIEKYDDIPRKVLRDLEEAYPDLLQVKEAAIADLNRRYPDKDDSEYFRLKDEFGQDRRDRFEALQRESDRGVPLNQIKGLIQKANTYYHDRIAGIEAEDRFKKVLANLEKKAENKTDAVERAYSKYIKVITDPKFIKPTGETDYDKRDTALRKLEIELGPDIWGGVLSIGEDYKASYPPIVQQYYRDMDVIRNSGYWEIEDWVFDRFKARLNYQSIDEVRHAWDSYYNAKVLPLLARFPQPLHQEIIRKTKEQRAPDLIALDRMIAASRAAWKARPENREAAIALRTWYGR